MNLHKRALYLSYFTVVYNVIEGIVSIAVGVMTGSIALSGFGADSFIESISGSIMIWRFANHERLTKEQEEKIEARAAKFVGWSFFIFAAWVLYESGSKLYFQEKPEPTLLGIAIAFVSALVMPVLFIMKYRTGKAIGSRALVADSKETLACEFMSLSLLVGLALNYFFGFWWADPATGFVIVYFLVKEGFEALEDEDDDDDD